MRGVRGRAFAYTVTCEETVVDEGTVRFAGSDGESTGETAFTADVAWHTDECGQGIGRVTGYAPVDVREVEGRYRDVTFRCSDPGGRESVCEGEGQDGEDCHMIVASGE